MLFVAEDKTGEQSVRALSILGFLCERIRILPIFVFSYSYDDRCPVSQ